MRYPMILMVVALSGCDSVGPDQWVPGSYVLATVEGVGIPARATFQGNGGYVVTGGALTLGEDGLYRDSISTAADDGSWSGYFLNDGRYTLDGTGLTLEPQWGTPACAGRVSRIGYVCDSPHGKLGYLRR